MSLQVGPNLRKSRGANARHARAPREAMLIAGAWCDTRLTADMAPGTRFPVFCYGSNGIEQMRDRCRSDGLTARCARLPDASRVFGGWSKRWDGAVASVQPLAGHEVLGSVVDLDLSEIILLDHFEAPNPDRPYSADAPGAVYHRQVHCADTCTGALHYCTCGACPIATCPTSPSRDSGMPSTHAHTAAHTARRPRPPHMRAACPGRGRACRGRGRRARGGRRRAHIRQGRLHVAGAAQPNLLRRVRTARMPHNDLARSSPARPPTAPGAPTACSLLRAALWAHEQSPRRVEAERVAAAAL